ncbi:MAG: hypothetical protein AAFU38_02405 [Bacteroidota bacterium]
MADTPTDPTAWPEITLRSFAVRVPPLFSEHQQFRYAEALQVKPPDDLHAWLDVDHRNSYRLRSNAEDWRVRFEEDVLDSLTDIYTTVYRADCTRLHRTERTIDGKPALDFAYRVLDRGWDGKQSFERYQRWVGVLAQGHVYEFAFRCAFADRAPYDPLVEGLVASFRQTAPLKPAEPPPPPPVPTPAQQRSRYTRAEVEPLVQPGDSHYDLPVVHLVLPVLGDGITALRLDNEDAEGEPAEHTPASGLTDGHVTLVNGLVAMGTAERTRIEALLFEHYRLCADATDYGVVKNPMDDPFDLATPATAFEQAGFREVLLSADGRLARFVFYPIWEEEHGCLVAWQDGTWTTTDW